MNIIALDQHYEYHIYGDGAEFRREHTELAGMAPDKIIFHDNGISEYTELSDFDRIIICGSGADNIRIAGKLLEAAPISNKIYIYAPNGDIVTNLFGSDRLICFGSSEKTMSSEIIFNESIMRSAREQHEFYYKKYGGTSWEKLNSFKRYSNVSSSDFMCVIERLIKKGVPMETLAELEHIRWCRYHYLNNWKYGEKTDPDRRLHNCLIPFSELSEAERLKDIEAIRSKMSDDKEND